MELITDQDKLREKVKEHLVTRATIAGSIGISFGQFSRWVHGKNVGAGTILKINKWLQDKEKENGHT